MTTSIYLSQLDALAKKVESFAQSLHCAKLYSSREQYTLFETFSLRLADAAESVPLAIKALKKLQRENNRQSRKLLLEAQSDIGDLVTTTNLKNRRAFVRNIKLLFTGPQISALDSDTTKGRKRLTQERCERICSLSPDGLISWAVAFVPSQWTANLMSNDTFDCLEEQIEPLATVMWPSEVYDVLDTLGEEEPLRPLQKYHEFLKAAQDGITNHGKRRRMDNAPLPPSEENREMKDMYANAPAGNISKMPHPFRKAIEDSRLWKWERSQGLNTTGCWPSLFPKDRTQDVSFTIWCGQKDGEHLTKFFGGQLEMSS